MKQKLSAKGFADADIEPQLERLIGERLLDDRRFAETYINYRIGRGYGPVRILSELSQRGIDKALAARVLGELDIDWEERARAAWSKKFAGAASDYREQAKQARFLQYRGFTSDQINRVVISAA